MGAYGGSGNWKWFIAEDELILEVFDIPEAVPVGSYGTYSVLIANNGDSPFEITDVKAHIQGPYFTERHLRVEPFIIWPGQVKVRGPIMIWVPLETPLGRYTVDTISYYNEEPLVSAEFSVEIVKE
jgi:hypothetical protein